MLGATSTSNNTQSYAHIHSSVGTSNFVHNLLHLFHPLLVDKEGGLYKGTSVFHICSSDVIK